MIGLYILGVIGIWASVAAGIASLLTRRWRGTRLRGFYALAAFALIVPLPFVDEIVGKYQFRALCDEGTAPRYDEMKARGRSVYMRQVPYPTFPHLHTTPSRVVPAWIPITEKAIDWMDKQTNEVVVSYKAYEASGGWVMRTLWPEKTGPLMFDPDSCAFNEIPLFKRLGITFQ